MNIKDYINVTDRIEIDEKCKEEIFNAMNNENRKNIKVKSKKKFFSVGIAVALLTCTGTAVFADELGVFDKLKHKQERVIVNDVGHQVQADKFDNNNYEMIGQNAVKVTESNEATESVANNLNIDVESVYCDGTNLIIGITAVFDKPEDIEIAERITFEPRITINGETYPAHTYENDERVLRLLGNLVLDEGSENTYTGHISFTMNTDSRITESATAEIELLDIRCQDFYYDEYGTLDPVTFNVDITPDTSKVIAPHIYVEDEGFEFKVYEISPAMMIVGMKYPEFYDSNTETIEFVESDGTTFTGPKYSIISLCYDENDEIIEGLGMTELPDYNDGFSVGCIASSDTSSLTVKFCNKQESDENGEPLVIKEMTVNLYE